MPISVVFDPPLPSDSPSTFNTKAFTLLGDLNDWSTQANALPGEVATNLTTLLASPPAIGSTTPAAGSFTTLSASGKATFNAANTAIQMSYVTGANSRSSMQIQGTDASSVTKTYYFGTNVFSTGGNLELRNQSEQGLVVKHATNEVAFDGAVTIPGSLTIGAVAGSALKVTLPNAGTYDALKTDAYNLYLRTLDNGATARVDIRKFNGTDIIASFLESGAVTFNSGTFGYGTGAGGTVTQATSKSTAVTLNKPSGRITLNTASLGANSAVTFVLNNTFISATDVLACGIAGGYAGTAADYSAVAVCSSGLAVVVLRNHAGSPLSEAVQIQFNVIKGSTT